MTEILDFIEKPEQAEKPYTFRKLNATDVFPMFTIISKIGVNEFMSCFDSDERKKLVGIFKEEHKSAEEDAWSVATVGVAAILNIVPVILGNLEKCEKEIFKLLSQTSNLSFEEVKALDLATFTEMVVDFVKKEEFRDFIKVVSKLFK